MPTMSKQRSNEEWLAELSGQGETQQAALTDLRDLLLRAALYFFYRNPGDLAGMDRDQILHRAQDCAQEALIAVLNHLSDFRGDSKFTTWAYKFAINIALTTARQERWKAKSLDELTHFDRNTLLEWSLHDSSIGVLPDRSVIQNEISDTIQDVIEHELTDRQREVLVMMVFHEVPMDEVVKRLNTNRNAIYKLLHDARRKLKKRLQERGFEIDEILASFAVEG